MIYYLVIHILFPFESLGQSCLGTWFLNTPAAASVPLVVYYFQIKHKVTKPFSLQKSFALLYFQSSGFSTKPETTGFVATSYKQQFRTKMLIYC